MFTGHIPENTVVHSLAVVQVGMIGRNSAAAVGIPESALEKVAHTDKALQGEEGGTAMTT